MMFKEVKMDHLKRTRNATNAPSMPIIEGNIEPLSKVMEAIAPIIIPLIQAIMMLDKSPFITPFYHNTKTGCGRMTLKYTGDDIKMKVKKIIGWLMIVAGGIYIGILGASGIEWLVSKTPVNVNIPLLVVSIILAFIGLSLSGQDKKFDEKVNKFKKGKR